MSTLAEQALKKEIEELEREVAASQDQLRMLSEELDNRKRALSILMGNEPPPAEGPADSRRFANFKKRPIDAMRILLAEAGGSMEQSELTQIMIREGVFDGKKSPENRALLAYDTNVRTGNIRKVGTRIVLLRPNRHSPKVTGSIRPKK